MLITEKMGAIALGSIKPSQIDAEEIAGALSRLCRFCGHGRRFYSVAEHSIRVASMLPDRFKFEGLLHDAAEAYVGDLSAAVRPYVRGFSEIEGVVHAAISNKFGIPPRVSPVVMSADLDVRRFELFELFGVALGSGNAAGFPAPVDLSGRPIFEIRSLWLEMFEELGGKR